MDFVRHRKNGILFWLCSATDASYVDAVAEHMLLTCADGTYKNGFVDSSLMWKVNTATITKVIGIAILGRTCCVKPFSDRRLKTTIRTALGLAKARRAFINGMQLRNKGIRCPRMIGYVEQRPFGPGLLVTQLCDQATHLGMWIQLNESTKPFLMALARFIRRMHDKGVLHHDLSPRNMLVQHHQSEYDFYILDYEDVRFHRKLSHRMRQENLHHLHERALRYMDVKTRLLFLKYYLNDRTLFREWGQALRLMIYNYPSKYTKSYEQGQ